MHAAVDWSGTPDAPDPHASEAAEVFLACAVLCAEREFVEETFAAWRQEDGRARTYEYRGYRASPTARERAGRFLLEQVRIQAVAFDKSILQAESDGQAFRQPALVAPATATLVLDALLREVSLHTIWHDEDIHNKQRRQAYNTEVKRKARAYGRYSPILKHFPSCKSDLVQLADMACYILQRDLRGLSEPEELRRLAHRLRGLEGNMVRWGSWSDLRSYL